MLFAHDQQLRQELTKAQYLLNAENMISFLSPLFLSQNRFEERCY